MPRQAKFGPHHPMWVKLLEMKASGFFEEDMIAAADEKSYKLTRGELRTGFLRAPQGLGLPRRGSVYLQRKVARDKETVKAIDMLYALAMEVTDRYYQLLVDRELAPTLQFQLHLDEKAVEAMNIAWAYWSELAKILKESGEPMTGAMSAVLGDQNVIMLTAEDFRGTVEQVVALVQQRLQALTPELAALDQFGHENVRELTDEESTSGDDEI